MGKLNRRQFIKKSVKLSAAIYGATHLPPWLAASTVANNASNELVVAKNGTPGAMVRQVVEGLGGMSRFVQQGQSVIVKPNIGWDRRPEQAANTNPEVVAEVVRLCLEAGASKVTVFDRTCNVARRTYKNSGIKQAAEDAGAKVRYVLRQKFKKIEIPEGKILKSWEFYEDALKADVLINVPVAKHHSLSRVSLSMKNLMGILGGERGKLHNNFPEKITDINTLVKPQLNILDAIRVLVKNGPQGGNLADVKTLNTVVAGVNTVTVDAYGATLFGLKPQELGFLQAAHQRGLGEIDIKKLQIKTG